MAVDDIDCVVSKLAELVEYCSKGAWESRVSVDHVDIRTNYIEGLYFICSSHVSSILTLLVAKQYRGASILLRSMIEIWVNVHYVYSSESLVWTWQILLQDLREQMRSADDKPGAYGSGFLKKEYEGYRDEALAEHSNLPVVQGVISRRYTSVERDLNIRDRAKIVDKSENFFDNTLESTYSTMYRVLSSIAHSTPSGIRSMYIPADGGYLIDVNQSSSHLDVLNIVAHAYMYYEGVTDIFLKRVLKLGGIPSRYSNALDDILEIYKRNIAEFADGIQNHDKAAR